MNELTMLERLGESLDPPDPAPPADLRRRVLTGARSRRSRWGRPAPGLRLAWGLGALGGVAAAATAVALLVPANPATVRNTAPPRAAADPPPGPVVVDAAHVLRLAAQHLRTTPGWAPRPDQFVFLDEVSGYTYAMPTDRKVHGKTVYVRRHEGPNRIRTWVSVDGTRDALRRQRPYRSTRGWVTERFPACRHGRQPLPNPEDRKGQPQRSVSCTVEGVFDSARGLPTDPEAMLRYLRQPHGDEEEMAGWSADQKAYQRGVDALAHGFYVPAVQAAVFQALSRLPVVTVEPHAVDILGRPGIAVGARYGLYAEQFVFDPHSYALMGKRRVVTDDPARYRHSGLEGLRRGDVFDGEAYLRMAVVDRAGQLPR
jgi:hypothetical protein